jgi:CO dehydrogenase nickel-insertion accessory protein CooC1
MIVMFSVNSDESNFGLHGPLGMDRPNDFMEYFGGKICDLGEGCACPICALAAKFLWKAE